MKFQSSRFHSTALLTIFGGSMLLPFSTAAAQTRYARAGWQAVLSTRAHNVSGTVTIVDADTFRVDNFFYDGGGIQVHFIVAPLEDRTTFISNRIVTEPNFLGFPYSGGSVTVDLPAGTTLDGQNAISLWCIPATANFGSGTFRSPLEIWRQANFGTTSDTGDAANAADIDKDNLSNLLEYATRSNPSLPNGNALSNISHHITQSMPSVSITFNYRPEATGIRYVVLRSPDLKSWTEVYRNDISTGMITRAASLTSAEDTSAQTITVNDSAADPATFWQLAIEPVL